MTKGLTSDHSSLGGFGDLALPRSVPTVFPGGRPNLSRRDRWFADSPLEGSGFEPSVPLGRATTSEPSRSTQLGHACRGSAQPCQVFPLRVGVAFFDYVALTSRLARSWSASSGDRVQ